MVGRALKLELDPRHEVRAMTRAQLDVTNAERVEAVVAEFRPHAIAHLAAWTDVDGCEQDAARAERVNTGGARNVALSARRHHARMLYASTDYVFDGTATAPIQEGARPNPINEYGRSKLGGELAIQEILTDYYIVRTSWVFGEGGRNFVDTVLRLAEDNPVIEMVEDQVGCPTYASDLAAALVRVIESRDFGIYHITNDTECSWYTLAQEVLKVIGSDVLLLPVGSDRFPRPARRPRYSVLANYRLHHILAYRLRSWREATREYVGTKVTA